MHFCYIDESGTSDIPGNTSHFILAGIAIPIDCWPSYNKAIDLIKEKHDLAGVEMHTGWLLRKYQEQVKIPNFDKLSHAKRRSEITSYRISKLLSLQKNNSPEILSRVVYEDLGGDPFFFNTVNEFHSLNNISQALRTM